MNKKLIAFAVVILVAVVSYGAVRYENFQNVYTLIVDTDITAGDDITAGNNVVAGDTLIGAGLQIGDTALTSTAAELNWNDGILDTYFTLADAGTVHDAIDEVAALNGVVIGGTASGDIVTTDGAQDLTNKSFDLITVGDSSTVNQDLINFNMKNRADAGLEFNSLFGGVIDAYILNGASTSPNLDDGLFNWCDDETCYIGAITETANKNALIMTGYMPGKGAADYLNGQLWTLGGAANGTTLNDFVLSMTRGINVYNPIVVRGDRTGSGNVGLLEFTSTLDGVSVGTPMTLNGVTLTVPAIENTSGSSISMGNTVEFLGNDDAGQYWYHYAISANEVSPGATGATLSTTGSWIYYLLDATNEYLWSVIDITDNWDGTDDIIVKAYVALNATESAGDTIGFQVVAEYAGEHDDMDTSVKTQTRQVSHSVTSDVAAGTVHELIFVLDYDLADNAIEKEDLLGLKFSLSSTVGVGAVRFLHADILYRTKYPQEVYSTTPTEG